MKIALMDGMNRPGDLTCRRGRSTACSEETFQPLICLPTGNLSSSVQFANSIWNAGLRIAPIAFAWCDNLTSYNSLARPRNAKRRRCTSFSACSRAINSLIAYQKLDTFHAMAVISLLQTKNTAKTLKWKFPDSVFARQNLSNPKRQSSIIYV